MPIDLLGMTYYNSGMDKIRVTITLDADVLAYIDQRAREARLERSSFINMHFGQHVPRAVKLDASAKTNRATKGKGDK